jgi:hypothetical protein
MSTSSIVSQVWSFCNPLRDVGVGYGDYIATHTCDKIEETISQSLQQAETLRQSILKKAFSGELVKNHDNPII